MSAKYLKKQYILFFVSAFCILLAFSCNYSIQQAKSKIKLKAKKLEMYVGDTYKFKLKKCTYKSSDKKIAKVSKTGKVKAKKAGNVRITIRKKNSKAKAVCRIKVGEHVTGIKITGAATILLKMGQTGTINADVSPKNVLYKDIEYTVLDNNIVSVSNKGLITPKNPGVTTISAVTKATDNGGRKMSAKVTVVVQDNNDNVVGDLSDGMGGFNNIVVIKTPVPDEAPTKAPSDAPDITKEPDVTETPDYTAQPSMVPTATPKPPQTIEEYVQSVVPDPANPLAAAFVVSNADGENRTVYLFNKQYSGHMSASIDGYSYSADKSVMEFLNRLENETGSVTNSAGTINVMRRNKKDSWKLTFMDTGVVYYFSGKINDDIYNSQFGIMIAEGNTLDHIVIAGQ